MGIQESKETIHHPEHYNNHPSGIEAIEICEEMSFNIGNAMKYLWRDGHKDSSGVQDEDLRKAIWYLNRELKRRMKRNE